MQPLDCLDLLDNTDGDNFRVFRIEKGGIPAPSQSKVVPSPIHGQLITPLTKPGHLRPFTNPQGERIDPTLLARKKWGYHLPVLDKDKVQRCTDAIVQLLCQPCVSDDDSYFIPLTQEQAVTGIPGVEFICSINKISSPGYPYVFQKRKGVGKTGYFGKYEFELDTPEARQIFSDMTNMTRRILDGDRPEEVVCIDTLKDAHIDIAKADRGKTRIFSNCNMVALLIQRQLTTPFFAHCMMNRINNFMSPGINALSPEWHGLSLRMRTKGNHVIAGDYSNFDGKIPSEAIQSIYVACVEWYRIHWDKVVAANMNVFAGRSLSFSEFALYCERVFMEFTVHYHVCEKSHNGEKYRVFYQVCNGQPSGNPGTALSNSAGNVFMFMYAWLDIFAGTELCTLDAFFENVFMCCYGDDVIANISADVIDKYNQCTLTDAMLRLFDIEFTDETKTSTSTPPSRRLEDISFLKRRFVYNDDIALNVGVLPVDLLLNITNWCKAGKEDPRLITLANLKSIAGELALHGRNTFDTYLPKLKEVARKLCEETQTFVYFDTYLGYISAYRNGESTHIE